jgi:hypothetical protein
MESAWPRSTATSLAESLRGGSGRRARSPTRDGLSVAKTISISGRRAIAFIAPETARFSGSTGASFGVPGLRFEMDKAFAIPSRPAHG